MSTAARLVIFAGSVALFGFSSWVAWSAPVFCLGGL